MKIGVLSDTHMKVPGELLDHILDDIFKEVSLIVHAGDIVSLSVLQKLEEKNAFAVCGNMDDFQVAGLIPQTRIIEVGNKQIGVVHGWGSKDGLRERILSRFDRQCPDIIIYGHSHVPFWGEVGGIMMFNPGSASHNMFSDDCTVGILGIENGRFDTEIISVSKKY
ncbi:MAG: metallophosphoesterase family protein [Pseudomonadota bacterium]